MGLQFVVVVKKLFCTGWWTCGPTGAASAERAAPVQHAQGFCRYRKCG
jgi:hypothetical protein